MNYFLQEAKNFLENARNSNNEREFWLSKIQSAGSSIYDCQRVYTELSTRQSYIEPNLFQQLINKTIESCIELKYSHALALAEKIGKCEKYDLDHCVGFHKSEKNKKELYEKAEMVTCTFNQMFDFANETTLFPVLESFIEDLGTLDEADKLMIMDDLINGCVVRIFQNNSPTVFFIYSKEKQQQEEAKIDLSIPRLKTQQVIRIVDQSNREKIGEGNLGTVYEVFEVNTVQNKVKPKALKEYKNDDNAEACLEKSFEPFEKLCQGNVCREIVKGRRLRKNCLLMKRYDMDLEKWFEKLRMSQSLTHDRLLNIMSDCLTGLTYIHSKEMCHQDIKLTNIFVKNGQCAIGDFDFLFDQNFKNVNFLLNNTSSYVFIHDNIELLKIITLTKTGVHEMDENGYEPKSHKNMSYSYHDGHVQKLIELKQSMDVAALGLVFLEGITGLKSISWYKEESLYKMAAINSEEQPELSLAYIKNRQLNVKAELTPAGLAAIEQAKLVHGDHLISLIMDMVDSFESRPTAKMILTRLCNILSSPSEKLSTAK